MKPIRCIIIEDEPEFIKLMRYYLGKIAGIEILGTFGDTVNATLQIEKLRPDVIFLDINISGLEGPEFIDLLEYVPKIIVVSGHSESIMQNYPEVKYIDFIQKPPTHERLLEALQKV